MVMELNASDDRGIEVVRTRIKQFVASDSVFFGKSVKDRSNIFKLVILDETDTMTSDAQAILRKIVEKYTYNTRFCLICNYIQNINHALQSRCTRFRFSPLNKTMIKKKVIEISKIEKIKVTEQGLDAIIKVSNGDMRKVLNILQSTSMTYNIVNEKNVNTSIGYPRKTEIDTIIRTIMTQSFQVAYTTLIKIKYTYGLSLSDIIQEIHNILLDRLLVGMSDIKIINDMDDKKIIDILDKMRTIEYNQTISTVDSIQIGGFISVFII